MKKVVVAVFVGLVFAVSGLFASILLTNVVANIIIAAKQEPAPAKAACCDPCECCPCCACKP